MAPKLLEGVIFRGLCTINTQKDMDGLIIPPKILSADEEDVAIGCCKNIIIIIII
jgi:hypothetical protein